MSSDTAARENGAIIRLYTSALLEYNKVPSKNEYLFQQNKGDKAHGNCEGSGAIDSVLKPARVE